MDQKAWDKLAVSEAHALAGLLSSDARCVMVIVIGADSDDEGTTHILHGVSGETRGAHLRQFITATERKLTWLRNKLYGRVA